MKNVFTLLLTFCFCSLLFANSSDYTYKKDRKYTHVDQLIGQTFIPKYYASGNGVEVSVDAGSVFLQFDERKVSVEGIKGVNEYLILSKSKGSTGFVFELSDMRSGSIISKMKVMTNKDAYIENIFLYDNSIGKLSFILAEKTSEEVKMEREFYTSETLEVRTYDELVGQTIHPYMLVENANSENSTHRKISMEEEIAFVFDNNKVALNKLGEYASFKIKDVNVGVNTNENLQNVYRIINLKLSGKVKEMKIYLSKNNTIEYIDVKGKRFFLMS